MIEQEESFNESEIDRKLLAEGFQAEMLDNSDIPDEFDEESVDPHFSHFDHLFPESSLRAS